MLQETEEILKLAKNSSRLNQIKLARRKYIKNRILKISKYSILILISFFILFLPKETGTVIGQWINDFFVTIYKNSIK